MNAGKGSRQRPTHGETYRRNYESIFRRFTEESPPKGEIIEGHEYLGEGCWHTVDQKEAELREET